MCTPFLTQTSITPALFRCPEGFHFDDETRRCQLAASLDPPCAKIPNVGRISREPIPIQLRIQDLDNFYYANRFYL